MFSANLFLAVAALAFGIASGRLDAPFLSQHVSRRDQESGFVCPKSDQHNLFFNLGIAVEDTAGLCKPDDISLVAELLQEIFDDLDVVIPDYENESMSTVVCPQPLLGKSYTYKVGGKFTRCGNYQGRRSLQVSTDAVCEWAELADLSAKLAAKTSRKAGALFQQQKKLAMKCEDLSEGQKAIATANLSMKAIRKAKKATKLGAKSAIQVCQQAKVATSDTALREFLQKAEQAASQNTDAAETVERSFAQMQGLDVCNPDATVQTKGGVNIDNLSDKWLTKVAYKLHQMTSERVTELFGAGVFGRGCFDEWNVKIDIFAVESMSYLSIQDQASWISAAKDC